MMKKLVMFVWVMTLVFGAVGTASALNYLDVNGDHSGSVWMGEFTNPSETWVFDLDNDILDVGDVNPGDTILTAQLGVTICDPEGDFGQPPFEWFLEFADLSLDGTTVFDNVEVDTGGPYFLDVLAWVTDHVLNVTISDVHGGGPLGPYPGNFWVTEMTVSGEYAPIPEPSTMILLGGGLIGLVALGRKKFKK
jgi:hypothetical protein